MILGVQRAELANEQYLALTSVLEGFVILKPNPEWNAEGEKISPTKKKVPITNPASYALCCPHPFFALPPLCWMPVARAEC